MRIEHLFETNSIGPTANVGEVSAAVDKIAEFMFDDSVEVFLNSFRYFKKLEEDPTLERSSTDTDDYFDMYNYIIGLDGDYQGLNPDIKFGSRNPRIYWKTLIWKAIGRTGLSISQTMEQIQKDDIKLKNHLIDVIKEYTRINFFHKRYSGDVNNFTS